MRFTTRSARDTENTEKRIRQDLQDHTDNTIAPASLACAEMRGDTGLFESRKHEDPKPRKLVTQYSNTFWTQIAQIPQISQIFKKTAWSDRLKKWEPVKHKNERAYFCAPGLPIVPKAVPWDLRAAGFPAILASNPGHPVNPV